MPKLSKEIGISSETVKSENRAADQIHKLSAMKNELNYCLSMNHEQPVNFTVVIMSGVYFWIKLNFLIVTPSGPNSGCQSFIIASRQQ